MARDLAVTDVGVGEGRELEEMDRMKKMQERSLVERVVDDVVVVMGARDAMPREE